MKIKTNNEIKEVSENITVEKLLIECNVEMPDMVSVQHNGEFVKRENFAKTLVKENDEIDFLYFMGGGQ
jgi:sulfur carrier protein